VVIKTKIQVGEIWKNGNEVCGSRYCRLSMKRHYLFFSEVSVDHYRLKSNIIFRGDVLLTSGRMLAGNILNKITYHLKTFFVVQTTPTTAIKTRMILERIILWQKQPNQVPVFT